MTNLLLLLLLLYWPLLVYSNWLLKEDKVCDPLGENILFTYTGFRIHRQYTYGLPLLHHVRLSHSDKGSVDLEAFIPTDRNVDLEWGKNMCVNEKLCYRAVRRKKYSTRLLSFYIPYSQVGGLFLCPAGGIECTNENATPVLPLLADRISHQWIEYPRMKRVVQRIPYLYTPNIYDPRYPLRHDQGHEWANTLDVNEDYDFSTKETHLVTNTVNQVLNNIHSYLQINSTLLPWERDKVEKELERDFKDFKPSLEILFDLMPLFETMASDHNITQFLSVIQKPIQELRLSEPFIGHATNHKKT